MPSFLKLGWQMSPSLTSAILEHCRAMATRPSVATSNTIESSKEAEMFRDLNGYYSRPERPRELRKLSRREEKVVIWILAINLVAAIIAPIGGASVIEALIR